MKKLALLSIIIFAVIACNSPEFTSAKMYVQQKNLTLAADSYEKALVSEPDNSLIPYMYARDVLAQQEKWERLVEMTDLAMATNPNQRLEKTFSIEDQRKPIEFVGEAVELLLQSKWANLYNKGVSELDSVRYDEAYRYFQLSSRMQPKDSRAYQMIVKTFYKQGKIDAALKELKIGLDRVEGEEATNLHILGADIALGDQNYQMAMEHYKKARETADDQTIAGIDRSLISVYIRLDRTEDAIALSEDALMKFPDDANILYNVGVLYQQLALRHYDPAKELFMQLSNSDAGISPEQADGLEAEFKQALKYTRNSKGYFLDANSIEASPDCEHAIEETKKMQKQLKDIFIPAAREYQN